jgi:hypothetical protein
MEELERESMDLINLAWNMIHWRTVASTIMNLLRSQKMFKFMNDLATASFSVRTMLHGAYY